MASETLKRSVIWTMYYLELKNELANDLHMPDTANTGMCE